METKYYKTRTTYYGASNPKTDNAWPVAIDIGYSAVKGFCSNKVFSFPSFVRKVNPDSTIKGGAFKQDVIRYRDEEGVWDVGVRAIELANDGETYGSDDELYSRNRYGTKTFRILSRVAMALALVPNKNGARGEEPIFIQTGLPIEYLKADTPLLKRALAGHHEFDMCYNGKSEWQHFDFYIEEGNIEVMAQPMGSYWCSICDSMGNPLKGSGKLMNGNTCVFDGGFGTLDVFTIKQLDIEKSFTFPEFGMREVFRRVTKEVFDQTEAQIPIPFLQKYLETGVIGNIVCPTKKGQRVDYTDPDTFAIKNVEISEMLERHSKAVCKEAMKRVLENTDGLKGFSHFIITGGTGAAWREQIIKTLSPFSIEVIEANRNEDLPSIFNNVRGYYMELINTMRDDKGAK